MDLKLGDLILSYETTFFSWLVRTVTRSQWSHVGVFAGSISLSPDVEPPSEGAMISAVPKRGVCLNRLSDIKHYAVYRVNNLIDPAREEVVNFCIRRIGAKYDYLQGVLLFYRILTDKLNINTGDPHPTSYVCSELVSEAYASVGVFFGKIVDNALPKTIATSPLVSLVS